MPEWWTYTLSDLQQFSLSTYRRLFGLYNAEIWPGQLVAAAAGVSIAVLLRRGREAAGGAIAAILAAGWLWTAFAFHAHRYATINRIAVGFAAAFAVQAALLMWTGVVRGTLSFDRTQRAGLAIFLFALVLQPVVGVLFGRDWTQVEVFGVAPDPTAVATLGVLLAAAGKVRWELAIVPALWCAMSGATLLAMRAPEGWITPSLAVFALLLAARKTRIEPRRNGRDLASKHTERGSRQLIHWSRKEKER